MRGSWWRAEESDHHKFVCFVCWLDLMEESESLHFKLAFDCMYLQSLSQGLVCFSGEHAPALVDFA